MDTATGALPGHTARPWESLDDSAGSVLAMLSEHIGLDLWMLTRLADDYQTAISVYPERGPIQPGLSLPSSATFCHRMVQGRGPQVASVVSAVPAYAELRSELIRLGLGVFSVPGAYIGVPIRMLDGSLYGTLCGFAQRAQPPTLRRHLRLVQFGGCVLATALQGESVR